MRLIRFRLLTIALIGVITSALSLAALVRILSVTTGQRIERAHDAVIEQAEHLARGPAAAEATHLGARLIGVRGGLSTGPDAQAQIAAALPEDWRAPWLSAVKQSAAAHARVVSNHHLGASVLVLCAVPAGGAAVAWAGYLVPPAALLRTWKIIIILLSLATALLVTTTLSALISFRRSTAALNRCLASLPDDLSAPIPRPRIRELAEISDGISRLARGLAQSRSEQERMAQQLHQKERLSALGRVATGVAHEVRNPLASIKLRLDLAAATTTLPPAAEEAIAHASSEIARLDRLVADLLVVAGRKQGPMQRTSLSALVRGRVDALQPWANSRGVTLDVQPPEGDTTATIDAEAVSRAVDNLLRNAVEATPPGPGPGQEVRALVVGERGELHVRIEDAGAGVQSRSAELFEPFFTTKADGTGLGLAISRAIARAHGGDVTYSRQGEGGAARTCFELSLSRRAQAASEAA